MIRSVCNKASLMRCAKVVAEELRWRCRDSSIRIRRPTRATTTNSDGWRVRIGRASGGLALEVWLDRFSGHPDRKLYAGFYAVGREPMDRLCERVRRKLYPIRIITESDVNEKRAMRLESRLAKKEFNRPILERLAHEDTYFGVYDVTRSVNGPIHRSFCDRALSFFEDVLRSMPDAKHRHENQDVYPRHENRKLVELHLKRERSSYLANERKAIDGYKCSVCGFLFASKYGALGEYFAEAHHVVALSRLGDRVKTSLDDLITVCSNCHRMLHQMEGSPSDVKRLRKVVRPQRKSK